MILTLLRDVNENVARLQIQSCVELGAGETWSGAAEQQVQLNTARRQQDRHETRSATDGGDVSALSQLVRQTRGRLYATRDLWRLLPEQVCDELTVTPFDNSSLCWNGRSYRCPLR